MFLLIFDYHFIFFHFFDSDYFIRFFMSTYSYFSECPSANNFKRFIIMNSDLRPPINIISFNLLKSIKFCFFMLNFLFDEFFFMGRKLHPIHLSQKFVPSFFFLFLFTLLLSILAFNVSLYTLSSFPSLATWLVYLFWRSRNSN